MLFAADVLSRNPGAEIIFDVKSTRNLYSWIRERGGKPTMSKTGHSFIKAKLKETGAPLAGEMSGHIFFKERWYGFDDALYAGARLLEILSREKDVSRVLEDLPDAISTPELHVKTAEGENYALIEKLKQTARFEGAQELITIDGLRVEYRDGFGLARPSNTTPVIVLRFEADNEAALKRIQDDFRRALLAVKSDLQLPFSRGRDPCLLQYVFVDIHALAVHAIAPLADLRVIADVERPAVAADEIHQIIRIRIVQVVRNRACDETHEIAGAHLVLLVTDVRDPAAGQDVDPLLVLMVEVQDAAGVAFLEAHEMHADRRQAYRVAKRTRMAHKRSIERMRPRLFM